jgi:hypothetical protein
MRTTPVEFLRSTIVWNWIGLAIAVSGGLTLFSTAANTFIDNPAFEVKLFALLPAALAWHVVIQVKTFSWSKFGAEVRRVAQIAGFVEMLLWLCVATAAIDIPYF